MRKTVLWIFILVLWVFSAAHAQSVPAGLADSARLFPRSQLQVQTTAPISVELNDDSRTAYETLAKLAGLNIIVDSSFRPVPVSLKLKDVGILEAFDTLSAQTQNFIEVVGDKTIVVSPDNQIARRHYQTYVLETVYLNNAATPSEITSIINALRTQLVISLIAQSTVPPAILMRDTPDKIALAEKIITDAEKSAGAIAPPVASTFAVEGNLLFSDRGSVRRVRPRLELKPKSTGPFSFDMNDDSRTIYENLAKMAGFNIVFDTSFRPVRTAFKFDNVDIFDALDYLGLQTSSFYEVLNSNTILVAPDNQTARRQYENLILATIYLPAGTTQAKMTETINALRTLLNASFIAQGTSVNAILMRDTPLKVALAEKVVAEMNPSAPGQQPLPTSTMWAGSINAPRPVRESAPGPLDGVRMRPLRLELKPKSTGPFSFDMNDDSRTIYENLARMAGFNILFDPAFRPVRASFKFDNVDIFDALDYLGLKTVNFYEVLNSNTILVAPDIQTARRQYENLILETIYLPADATPMKLTETITALRTLLNMSFIAQSTSVKAILMRDTPSKLALAEKVVAEMNPSAPGQQPLPISTMWAGSVNLPHPVRESALEPLDAKLTAPASIDVDQSVREAYTTIAALAGLNVTFDDALRDTRVRLRLDNTTISDALDFLGFQAITFWQPVDSKTIIVGPDNQTTRRKIQPLIEAVFPLTNVTTSVGITEITITLRTLLNFSQIETRDNTIVILDVADKIPLAQKVIADMDKPAR